MRFHQLLLVLTVAVMFSAASGARAETGAVAAAQPPAKLAPDAAVGFPEELLTLPKTPPSVHPVGTATAASQAVPPSESGPGSTGAHLAIEGNRTQARVSSPALASGERDLALVVRLELPF